MRSSRLSRFQPKPPWAPTRSWSWGFGASTSDVTDDHWVDNLRIVSSDLSLGVSYPVRYTLNRQDYFETGLSYTYQPDPIVSIVSPLSGPAGGGTRLTLHGTNLRNGTDYRCR